MESCANIILLICFGSLISAHKALFSFGSSYSATGFLIDGAQPSQANIQGNPIIGTWTNKTHKLGTWCGGENYINYLTTDPNVGLVFSYNFAQAGCTIDNDIISAGKPISFKSQVETLFEPKYSHIGGGNGEYSADDAFFTILMGDNDALKLCGKDDKPHQPDENMIQKLLDAYFYEAVDAIYKDGGRKFLFGNVPPLDKSPNIQRKGNGIPEACAKYIGAYNDALSSRVTQWSRKYTDAMVTFYDFHTWMQGVIDDPTGHGFTDATHSGDGDSGYIWWSGNDLHTTSHLQKELAEDMVGSLNQLGWGGKL